MFRKYGFFLIAYFVWQNVSYAVDLELTQGQSKALPIAIVPFKGEVEQAAISSIIKSDLKNSGAFNFISFDAAHQPYNALTTQFPYWKSLGVNNLVVGEIKKTGSQYSVFIQLLDPISKAHIMFSREYKVPANQLTPLAHHISDLIYLQLTGHKGIFSTRLAYIVVDRKQPAKPSYRLDIADYDGSNAQTLLVSHQPIMSPAWSPDGKYLAYVSFENKRSEIYMVDVATGQRQLISNFPGINGAPTWSQDGKKLAMVLSKSGHPKLYLYDFKTEQFKQLTHGSSIDTEPRFTADSSKLIFTSNRGGSPQIYQMNINNQQVKRLTFAGSYNASARQTSDQKNLVILHRGANKKFSISMQSLKQGTVTPVTFSRFDESPSIAPNDQMIVYASKYKGQGILRVASLNGNVNFKLPSQPNSDMQEPSWSPFSS